VRGEICTCKSIAFSSDGRYLAGAYISGVIVVWDVESKRPVFSAHRFESELKEIPVGVCFVRDGDEEQLAYCRGPSVRVERWNVQHNQPSRTWTGLALVCCLTIHPRTGKLIGAGKGGSLVEGDLNATAEWALRQMATELTSLSYSPDGEFLAGVDLDRKIRTLHPLSFKVQTTFETDHKEKVTSFAVAPARNLMATASLDGTFTVRHRDTGKELFEAPQLKGPLHSVAFDPEGKRLAVGGSDGILELWDLDSQKKLLTLGGGHEHDVTGVAFSPDGRWLASSGADARVIVWDARTGKEVCRCLGHIGTVSGVAFSRDGNRLASAGMDNTVKLWDTSVENLLRIASRAQAQRKTPAQATLLTLLAESPVTSVAFGTGPVEGWLAATHVDGNVRLWNGTR
jgi:WD40 repeat protein